jgi:hypothetical protein
MAFDISAFQAENQRLKSQGQGQKAPFLENFVPMPEGEGVVTLRLLPPAKGQKLPFVATRTHKINEKNLHCPMTLVNDRWVGNCPVCNHNRSLWKQSDSADEDDKKALIAEATSIKASERYYWNAIVRKLVNKNGETELNVGPKIFSCGVKLHKKIIRYICGAPEVELEPLGDVTDVNTGRDLKVVKQIVPTGGKDWPDYAASEFSPKETVAGPEADVQRWLETLHDLQALRQVKSKEELEKEVRIHRGLEQAEDTSFPTHEAPATKVTPIIRAPVASKTDEDEALADDDFLKRLRGM